MIIAYVFTITVIIICLASIVPICQCLCYTYGKKENNKRYLFSEELYNRHLEFKISTQNDYKNLNNLWKNELQYDLP